jgi:hypothetical protein
VGSLLGLGGLGLVLSGVGQGVLGLRRVGLNWIAHFLLAILGGGVADLGSYLGPVLVGVGQGVLGPKRVGLSVHVLLAILSGGVVGAEGLAAPCPSSVVFGFLFVVAVVEFALVAGTVVGFVAGVASVGRSPLLVLGLRVVPRPCVTGGGPVGGSWGLTGVGLTNSWRGQTGPGFGVPVGPVGLVVLVVTGI